MKNLTDAITDHLTRVCTVAMAEVTQQTQGTGRDIMLRRFRASYDKLEVEELDAVARILGHDDTEKEPCDACKIMAAKELSLRDREV